MLCSARAVRHQIASTIKEELDARFSLRLAALLFPAPHRYVQEAEDLTQETFVRLIGSHSFEMAEEAQAFVFRVASNLLRDRGRSQHRMRRFATVPLDLAGARQV